MQNQQSIDHVVRHIGRIKAWCEWHQENASINSHPNEAGRIGRDLRLLCNVLSDLSKGEAVQRIPAKRKEYILKDFLNIVMMLRLLDINDEADQAEDDYQHIKALLR